ncbi:methylated-DNA--cysteine S-methyltransferase [Piromyces finnis]|uniref:Methylated-DNA--protein-cysteine methyltransferase n=1 Tax=Piromyces finnis TaxID=1754191 RepID=A0A1Y1VBM5_9FUNG|nr:methylated-DNA--cysteine S-methyltransferase [Piromyces finnis]|eukprot:ORX51113.1 methylated-DNA--cysteine S-methyltransferase [Piromyces finnis]
MNVAYYNLELGILEMKYHHEILYSLSILKADDTKTKELNETAKQQKNSFTDKIFKEINEYMIGERKTFDIPYKFQGTSFQKKVWKVLETIPYGETFTYGDVAKKIKNPKAVRAVGGACHRNPIWLIVPCHRVVGTKGNLTGYAGGVDMKKKLLTIEQKYKKISTQK